MSVIDTLFSGGSPPAGAWFTPQPVTKFTLASVACSNYGGDGAGDIFDTWLDSSGNGNDIYNGASGFQGRCWNNGTLYAGDISANEYVASTGGGASTLFYLCLSFDTTNYFGTFFSDVDTANTGFRLQYNGNTGNFTFSAGTGTSRITADAASGTQWQAPGKHTVEAFWDGSVISISVDKGTPVTTSCSTVSAGTAAFTIAAHAGGSDPANGKYFQVVYTKNYLPSASTRSAIASICGDKAGMALRDNGALAVTESYAKDTFSASGAAAVAITGSLAVTESYGRDSLAASGSTLVLTGAVSVTESYGPDTLAIAGTTVVVGGALSVTESYGSDTLAIIGAANVVGGHLAVTEAGGDTFAGDGGSHLLTAGYANGVGGMWLDATPASRFQLLGNPGSYTGDNRFDTWLDRSGNGNNLVTDNLNTHPGFAIDWGSGQTSGSLSAGQSCPTGGGSTTAIYLCAAVNCPDAYYGTIFSDVDTAFTGFRLNHDGGEANDFIFSAGTGTARVTASVASGNPLYGHINKHVIEAWYDGSTLSIRVDKGAIGTASCPSVVAGRSGFSVFQSDLLQGDLTGGDIYQYVYAKNFVPGEADRNAISSMAAGRVPGLAIPNNGYLATAEGSGKDTFAATGTAGTLDRTGSVAATESGSDAFASTGTVVVLPVAAATYFGEGAAVTGTGDLTGIAWPASHAADDIGLLVIEGDGSASTATVSGWAHVTGSPVVDVASASGSTLQVLWKRATSASEATVSVTDTGDHTLARIHVIRGCRTAGDPWEVSQSGAKATASTSVTLPSSTTLASNRLVVMITSRPDDDASTTAFGVPSNANLSGIADVESGTVDGNGGGFQFAYGVAAAIGATGTSSVSLGALSVTNAYVVLTMVQAVTAATGSLDATETYQKDAFSGVGASVRNGSMAAVESGSDVFHASSTPIVPIQGFGAISEHGELDHFQALIVRVDSRIEAVETGSDAFAASGTLPIAGAMDAAESGADTFNAFAGAIVSGSIAAVESGADVFASPSWPTQSVTGSLATSESGADVFVAFSPGAVPSDPEFMAWLALPTRVSSLLVEVSVQTGGVETTRYLSSSGYTSGVGDTPSSTHYLGVISGGGVITEQLSLDGSAPSMAFGDIELNNADGALDGWLDDIWTGRACRIYIGDQRWSRAGFRLIFDGITENLTSRANDVLNITVRDKLQRMNTAVTSEKLGGASTNADRVLPLTFGEVHNLSPLLIDKALLKYKFNNGPSERVIEVRVEGVVVGYTADLSAGNITLTASPPGTVTVSAQGDSFGAYRNTAAALVQRLATGYGTDPLTAADLDAASLAEFDAMNRQPLGLYLPDLENVLSACQQIAASVGAEVVMPANGKLRLIKLALPATGVPTAVNASNMFAKSLEIEQRTSVQAAVKQGYAKNWTVQTNLQTGIPPEHKDLYAQEWLTATASDSAVATNYKLALEPEQSDTLLLTKADADAEVARKLGLWKQQRTVFRYRGTSALITEKLGGYQTITHSRFGLSAGRSGQIVSIERDWLAGQATFGVLI